MQLLIEDLAEIAQLPRLPKLKQLIIQEKLTSLPAKSLPAELGQLVALQQLSIHACTGLTSLPAPVSAYYGQRLEPFQTQRESCEFRGWLGSPAF